MAKKKQTVDVAVILADASPIMTLQRVGRLDVLALFNVPIHIVDQVHWEVTKPENDPTGEIAATLHRLGNRIQIIETLAASAFRRGAPEIQRRRQETLESSRSTSTP